MPAVQKAPGGDQMNPKSEGLGFRDGSKVWDLAFMAGVWVYGLGLGL